MANKAENSEGGKIKIQYYRSSIGYAKKQKEIVRSLGITKLNQTVMLQDSAASRGYRCVVTARPSTESPRNASRS